MDTNKLPVSSSRQGGLPLFNRLSYQLIAIISITVTIGLVAMVMFYSERQRSSIQANNEEAMHKVTESVINSLRTVMIAGYADIAEVYADNLKTVPGVVDFRILRISGNEAFRDNKTIRAVNEYRGDDDFELRDHEAEISILPADDPHLQQTLAQQQIVLFYEQGEMEEQFLTFLAPIQMAKKCDKCHDETKPVRGVVKLTTSLGAVHDDLRQTRLDSIKILLVAISVIIGVAVVLVRRSVTRPISEVSDAMAAVSAGQVNEDIPVLGHDELAQMAGSFNTMTTELSRSYTDLENEQNKLATIILTAGEGIVATNSDGRVVLVNPAIIKILRKSHQQIVDQGLRGLLDDAEQMECWLALTAKGHQSHIVEYQSKLLNVVVATIRDESGVLLGSTAFVRDVTTEKQLEQKLRALSLTDGLTGLYNRRHFDEVIRHEMDRAESPDWALSVLMFDIDHFKKFNDNYGHDQGDRVLQQVAQALQQAVRTVDICCRYGGEEFVVILPSTDVEGATILAERVRASIEAMRVDGLQVTVSVGVSHLIHRPEANADELVEAADKAMYGAKQAGRNRVVVAQDPSTESDSKGHDADV
ncbi:MAG: diguanylate cyclase [Halopseudomonas sp.]